MFLSLWQKKENKQYTKITIYKLSHAYKSHCSWPYISIRIYWHCRTNNWEFIQLNHKDVILTLSSSFFHSFSRFFCWYFLKTIYLFLVLIVDPGPPLSKIQSQWQFSSQTVPHESMNVYQCTTIKCLAVVNRLMLFHDPKITYIISILIIIFA